MFKVKMIKTMKKFYQGLGYGNDYSGPVRMYKVINRRRVFVVRFEKEGPGLLCI